MEPFRQVLDSSASFLLVSCVYRVVRCLVIILYIIIMDYIYTLFDSLARNTSRYFTSCSCGARKNASNE